PRAVAVGSGTPNELPDGVGGAVRAVDGAELRRRETQRVLQRALRDRVVLPREVVGRVRKPRQPEDPVAPRVELWLRLDHRGTGGVITRWAGLGHNYGTVAFAQLRSGAG